MRTEYSSEKLEPSQNKHGQPELSMEGGAEVIVHEGKHDDDTDRGEDKAEDLEA
jgi:hypothetical protein